MDNGNLLFTWSTETSSGDTSSRAVVAAIHGIDGAQVVAPFQVNEVTNGTQWQPLATALEGGGSVIAYDSGSRPAFRIYEDDGTPRTNEEIGWHTSPDFDDIAALPGGGFAAVGGGHDAYLTIYAGDGSVLVSDIQINQAEASFSRYPSISVMQDGGIAVAWGSINSADGDAKIKARVFEADGTPRGDEAIVGAFDDESQYFARVAPGEDGGFVVVWHSSDAENGGIRARAFDGSGKPTIGAVLTGDVLADNGNGVDSDAEGDALTVSLVDDVSNGTLDLNADGTFTYIPDAGFSGFDSFTYIPNDGTEDGNVATVTINIEAPNTAPVAVDDTVVVPALVAGDIQDTGTDGGGTDLITLANGDLASVYLNSWYVAVAMHDPADGTVVSQFDVPGTFTNRMPNAAALDDGGFVVVWQETFDAVHVHLLNGDGTARIDPVEIEGSPVGSGLGVTALTEGRFIVHWYDSDGHNVRAALFSANGTLEGDTFLLNSRTASSQSPEPSAIVALDDGGFLATWVSDDSTEDGSGSAVMARVFDADGVAAAPEFVINAETEGNEYGASATRLDDGTIVVTWQSSDEADTNSTGIKARMLDATGIPTGAEFLVNAETAGDQRFSEVTALGNGGFVVTWQANTPENTTAYTTWARTFGADGTPTSGDLRVSETDSEFLIVPSVTAIGEDGFAVAWDRRLEEGGDITELRVYHDTGGGVSKDTATTLSLASLLANDTDADGDVLSVTALGTLSAEGASLTLNADGTFTYDASAIFDDLYAGETWQDSFSYTISDGNGGTDTGTATLTVVGSGAQSNAAPVATVDDQTIGLEEYPWKRLSSVLSTTDQDGDAITQYRLFDTQGADNWWADGGTVDASDGYVTSNLTGIWFTRDTSASTQTLGIEVFDGTNWSDLSTFTLVTEARNTAPVVTVEDQTIGLQEYAWKHLESVLTVTDADGDAVTRYQVWDSVGGDNWWADGGIVDASTGYTTDDLSSVWFKRDDEASSQALWVRANDGESWGAWDRFELTTGIDNLTPVVAVDDQRINLDQYEWKRLDSVLSVSDPDGDAIVQYQVWDSEGGNNWWADGGIVDSSRGYTTDDLSSIWFKRDDEASTQTLWVRANDGEEWGAWDSFNLITA